MKQISDLDNTALSEELGRRISYLRISARMKQEELAKKAGISRYSLQRLEKGAAGFRLDSFLSVLRVLGVLNAISLVLPEPTLTPLQMAELEKKQFQLPKRVRSSQKKSSIRWGDEQ